MQSHTDWVATFKSLNCQTWCNSAVKNTFSNANTHCRTWEEMHDIIIFGLPNEASQTFPVTLL